MQKPTEKSLKESLMMDISAMGPKELILKQPR